MNVRIPARKLHPDAVLPHYATDGSAGADLFALLDNGIPEQTIQPGDTVLIRTGIAVAIPDGYAGLIFARSGLSLKRSLAPANKVGVIDADYRGELKVALHNHGKSPAQIGNGERIAQLVIVPVASASFEETDTLDGTDRGSGGFGSTGTR